MAQVDVVADEHRVLEADVLALAPRPSPARQGAALDDLGPAFSSESVTHPPKKVR